MRATAAQCMIKCQLHQVPSASSASVCKTQTRRYKRPHAVNEADASVDTGQMPVMDAVEKHNYLMQEQLVGADTQTHLVGPQQPVSCEHLWRLYKRLSIIPTFIGPF